ncbi:MAG TPA: transglutaminaseTgpA domain-containing protein [Egibacteraceae bacterium]|nr:transglutaminaseTgpA domain-containing protein [Egibacteraceae bacterium]
MSAGLRARPVPPATGPSPVPPERAEGAPPRLPEHRTAELLLPAVLGLLFAACLPLGRVFLGWSFLRPVLGAVVVAVGLVWGTRRLGLGPVSALLASAAGWALFVTVAFLRDTAVLGLVPTGATLDAFVGLWTRGVELIGARPAPVFAEPGLLLLTVTGVWAVAHAVEGLVFRLESPVRGVLVALGLWMVPLLITVGEGSAAPWTVPFLAAAALVLLLSAGDDARQWGREASGSLRTAGSPRAALPSGVVIAAVAIVVGVLVAGILPGFGQPPWYELRGVGGTTLTTNPIVTIRHSLVAQDRGPVMRVTTPRPVYLRTTSLDLYSRNGEWTNAGIRGTPVRSWDGRLAPDGVHAARERLDVEVEVANLPGAVLVPAPFEPRMVQGQGTEDFKYDRRLATITTDRGATLQPGDRYRVEAVLPDPDPAALPPDAPPPTELVALPPNVPSEVAQLAREIVDGVGAETAFEKALALQDEFQSGRWEYSLEPQQGHGGDAMLAFITNRAGYCEQYAGTMAVMLRTLGVPARVAVGFTPGEQVGEDGPYVVTNGHAHAWVEVLLPGYGWLSFEPTPRRDGNLLPPTTQSLVPARTLAQQAAAEMVDLEQTPADAEFLPQRPEPEATAPAPASEQASPSAEEQTGAGWLPLALLLALVGVGAALAVARGRRGGAPPLDRVLSARASVERIGRGLGLRAMAWETDQEYLERLAGAARGPQGAIAAATLGGRAAEARYAPQVAAAAAAEAEAAADVLRASLLEGRSAPARVGVQLRGRVSTAASAASLGAGRVLRRS